jgi:hypothetical protein
LLPENLPGFPSSIILEVKKKQPTFFAADDLEREG